MSGAPPDWRPVRYIRRADARLPVMAAIHGRRRGGCASRDGIVPRGIGRSAYCRTSLRPDCRTCSIRLRKAWPRRSLPRAWKLQPTCSAGPTLPCPELSVGYAVALERSDRPSQPSPASPRTHWLVSIFAKAICCADFAAYCRRRFWRIFRHRLVSKRSGRQRQSLVAANRRRGLTPPTALATVGCSTW
jgi:hypothetical protein